MIIICTFYTTVGGIKGVVWTDVVQSVIMYGSLVVIMIKGTMDLGGFGVVWQRNLDGGRINAPELVFYERVTFPFVFFLIWLLCIHTD